MKLAHLVAVTAIAATSLVGTAAVTQAAAPAPTFVTACQHIEHYATRSWRVICWAGTGNYRLVINYRLASGYGYGAVYGGVQRPGDGYYSQARLPVGATFVGAIVQKN